MTAPKPISETFYGSKDLGPTIPDRNRRWISCGTRVVASVNPDRAEWTDDMELELNAMLAALRALQK